MATVLLRCWSSVGPVLVRCCSHVDAINMGATPDQHWTNTLVYGFVVALGGFARPLGLAVASGVRGMSESAWLPDSPPLASESESGPEVWV